MSNNIPSAGKNTLSAIGKTFKAIGALIWAIVKQFGLIVPLLYAVFGLILYLSLDLKPNTKDINTVLFWVGAALSVLSSAVISVKRVRREEEDAADACPLRPRRRRAVCPNTAEYKRSRVKIDSPKIYMSNLEPDKLIHEYEDRFIIYETDERGAPRYIKTEYKFR